MHDAARRPDILPDFDANGIGGMLVLSRRVDERIVIDESIVITVIEVRGNRVRFGFQAREGINIRRAEIEPLPTTTGGPNGSDQ